jgi:hypothetical protein
MPEDRIGSGPGNALRKVSDAYDRYAASREAGFSGNKRTGDIELKRGDIELKRDPTSPRMTDNERDQAALDHEDAQPQRRRMEARRLARNRSNGKSR